MSKYEEIKATLESPGMKHIVRGLRAHHKAVYRKYRECGSMEELLNLQTVQKVIDTTLPQIVEKIMNSHLDPKKDTNPSLWFRFTEWVAKIRSR